MIVPLSEIGAGR